MSTTLVGSAPTKKTVLDRNSTNFTFRLLEFFKNVKLDSKFSFLKYYQNLARVFAVDVGLDSRGLLIYQSMGLGKSILAVSIAIDMMGERQPIILLTKSLQANMRGAIHKYVRMRGEVDKEWPIGMMSAEELDGWIDDNFQFVSMNAGNMIKQMNEAADGGVANEFDAVLEKKMGKLLKMSSLDGKLLVVDEAHNLFRAITNGSKNGLALYHMVMRSKNLKIMFFTGTPSVNDPFELVPCFNMLGSRVPGRLTLPENYLDFVKLFVNESKSAIKNKSKFQNRIFGLVSFVTYDSQPGKAFGIRTDIASADFPEEYQIKIEKVNMQFKQYASYNLAREKEKEEKSYGKSTSSPAMMRPKSAASSSYRVKSRQISNFDVTAPGQGELSPKYVKIHENIESREGQLGLVYSQFIGSGGLASFSKYLVSLGWTARPTGGESGMRGHEESDGNKSGGHAKKMNRLKSAYEYLNKLENQYTEKSGGDDESLNIMDHMAGSAPKTFAVISGEVGLEERREIQIIFNSAENKNGKLLRLLLVSSTGAEGLDLKNVRHVHIVEPYWNWGRVKQVIARAVRNNSHIDLPENDRNVQPYIYLSVPPASEKLEDGTLPLTTDVEIYNDAVTKQVMIESFNETLKEVSIECLANGEAYCRSCYPNNKRLFTEDIDLDARSSDPCSKEEVVKKIVHTIELDGKEYFYNDNPESIYDLSIYKYDDTLGAHVEVDEADPLFAKIIKKIEEMRQ